MGYHPIPHPRAKEEGGEGGIGGGGPAPRYPAGSNRQCRCVLAQLALTACLGARTAPVSGDSLRGRGEAKPHCSGRHGRSDADVEPRCVCLVAKSHAPLLRCAWPDRELLTYPPPL